MKTKKTAVIYARQSSGADDFSDSVENQINNCKALAKSENIEIVGVFQDLNTSGKTYPVGAEKVAENDAAFQKWFMQQTGNKKFRMGLGQVMAQLSIVDYVIVDDMTRLYRPFRGSYLENYINNALTDNNVAVLQVKGGKIDLSKFDQSLITMLKNAINDEQIANQKKKSMQQLRKRRDSGFFANGGGKAFGTVYNPADGSIEIKAEFIPAIQYIFNEIEKYTPYLTIIQHLNTEYSNLVDKCFYYTNLYHIVDNPLYCGYMTNSEGFLIQNRQITNPCITFEQWQKVKELVHSKKGKPAKAKKNWLPFSGLLYCGNCGSRLVSGIDKGRVYYYCMAGSNYLKDVNCKGSRVYVEVTKDEYTGLFNAIKPLLVLALFKGIDDRKQRAAASKNLSTLQADIVNLQTKQQGLTDLYIKGLLSIEDLEKNLAGIKAELQQKQEKILMLSHTPDETSKHLAMMDKKFTAEKFISGELENSEYETALKMVVKRIDVYTDKIIVDTIYGIVEIPRTSKGRHFTTSELVINGKTDDTLSCTIIYKTGCKKVLADWGKIKILSR